MVFEAECWDPQIDEAGEQRAELMLTMIQVLELRESPVLTLG
jgi:hypothetical protein